MKMIMNGDEGRINEKNMMLEWRKKTRAITIQSNAVSITLFDFDYTILLILLLAYNRFCGATAKVVVVVL